MAEHGLNGFVSLDSLDSLSELVRDYYLQATFSLVDNRHQTRHTRPNGRRDRSPYGTWLHLDILGSGGSGHVELQRLQDTHELRAVKHIRVGPDFHNKVHHLYKRELEALAKFSNGRYADSFVRMTGWYKSPDFLHIAMEYCEHGDLWTYLKDERKCPDHSLQEDQVQEIASQLVTALDMMHQERYSHGDLKPANILIMDLPPNVWVKLGDLGLSKRADQMSSNIRGTPGFDPPELMGFRDNEPKSKADLFAKDMWCLGETLFLALAGHKTFETPAEVGRYQRGDIPFPVAVLNTLGVSADAVDFIRRAMAPNPFERLTAGEASLHAWVKRENSRNSEVPLPPPMPLPSDPDRSASQLGSWTNSTVSAVASPERDRTRSQYLPWTDLPVPEPLRPERSDTASLPASRRNDPGLEIQSLNPTIPSDRDSLYQRFLSSLPTEPVPEDDTHAAQGRLASELMLWKFHAQGPWDFWLRHYTDQGYSVNIRDFNGQTPLHHALMSQYQREDKVRALVRAGADVTMRNYEEVTPVSLARNVDESLFVFLLVTWRRSLARETGV